jgi:hypothetical protein
MDARVGTRSLPEMTHRSKTGKRVVVSLLASMCLIVGSPVAASSAASGGAQKPVSANHGDCKNDNSGKHKGYVCPTSDTAGGSDSDTSTGGGDVTWVY